MRYFLTIAFFLICNSVISQDDWRQRTDSVTRLIQQHYNKRDFTAIYEMAGEKARKELDEKGFIEVMQTLNTQLGNLNSFQYSSSTDKVNNYRAFFVNAEMKLLVSIDSKNKFETFF